MKQKGISAARAAIIFIIIIAIAVGGYFLLSRGVGPPSEGEEEEPTVTENYGIVMGKITSTAETPLDNVIISVAGQTSATNAQGWFSVSNVNPGSRVLATFSKTGYLTSQKATEVRAGESSFIEVTLAEASAAQSLDATVGENITQGGGSIAIEENSLVDSNGDQFTGTAEVSLTIFDPSDETDRDAFPGSFAGLENGEENPFESFGFMNVLVTGDGNPLQLASGKTSTIEIPIPSGASDRAPATIDLWYYDTADGYWKKEGTATKVGSVYQGTISHFSWWNADYMYDQSYLTGNVCLSGEQLVCTGVVTTGPGETKTITFPDGSIMTIGPDSTVDITNVDIDSEVGWTTDITTFMGKTWYDISDAWGGDKEVNLHDLDAVTGVRGTEFILEAAEDTTTTLTVLKGTVEFSNLAGTENVTVYENQTSTMTPGGTPSTPVSIDPGQVDKWWGVSGVTVVTDGVDYYGTAEETSGENGRFRVPAKPNSSVKIWATRGGRSSEVLTVSTGSAGGETDVGTIVLTAPNAQITLTWGEDPNDLDSHLAATDNENFHVYYSDKGSLVSTPYAELDTDDRSSYGPEVISISRFSAGKYRYSVHHYAGYSTIENSGAEVNVVIKDIGIYKYTPPANQSEGTNIWRVFDMVVDSAGKVTAVNPINDYVTGDQYSELLYPQV